MLRRIAVFILLLGAGNTAVSQQNTPQSPLPPTPTTKVIALGHLTAPPPTADFRATMQREVSDTVRLYLTGKIDQWFVRKDRNGVVFVLNATSVEEAQKLLDSLPLSRSGMMQFDLIPVGPLSPLAVLLSNSAVPDAGK